MTTDCKDWAWHSSRWSRISIYFKDSWWCYLRKFLQHTFNLIDKVCKIGHLFTKFPMYEWTSLVIQMIKNLPAMQETQFQFLDWDDPLEKEMATHSSSLTWKIPWTEEPGGLQSMGSQRVGPDWVTNIHALCVNWKVTFVGVSIKFSLATFSFWIFECNEISYLT